jgi:LysB family phage lysis regulatory protein
MSLTDLIPVQYRLLAAGGIALVLLLAGAGLVWWGLSPRIGLQSARADHAEQALADSQKLVERQADVLAEQQKQIGQVTALDQRMRALEQTVNRNAEAQSRALEELKRHDQAVADYLAAAVPAALGRLYERPETTDPTAYHSPDRLPADPVPATGAAGAAHQ